MLHSNIEAPDGFFGNDDNNIVLVPPIPHIVVPVVTPVSIVNMTKPPGTSKFSFSKFGSSKTVKPIIKSQGNIDLVVNLDNLKIENVVEYPIYNGFKIAYSYDTLKNPRLEKNKNVAADFSQLLQQREANKDKKVNNAEFEKKEGINSTMNLFSNSADIIREEILEENKKDKMLEKADDALSKLQRNHFVAKPDNGIKNYLLPTSLFEELYILFTYMNPEERGMMLINMIFGGLISRNKMDGFGGKAGTKEFPSLLTAIGKLKIGGANPENGRIYTKTLEYIINNGLKYRADAGSKEQVSNMTSFIDKLARRELAVYFPSNLLFSDPTVSQKENGRSIENKSVPLSGRITSDNLVEFFGSSKQITQKAQATLEAAKKTEETKKKIDNKRGYVGRSNFMEDEFI